MLFDYLKLSSLFLSLDSKVIRKYKLRLVFSILQTILVVALFYFISITFGEVSRIKSNYFPFVATGLSFHFLFSSVVNAAGEKIREYRNYGVLEEILFTNYSPLLIFISIGYQSRLIGMFKCIITVLCIDWFFSLKFNIFIFLLTFLLILTLSTVLSLISVCSFLLWKRANIIEFVGSLFTLFLTGIYFPIEVLPKWLYLISKLNPLKVLLDLFRSSFGLSFSKNEQLNQLDSTFYIFVVILLLLMFSLIFYKYTINRLKKIGSLSSF